MEISGESQVSFSAISGSYWSSNAAMFSMFRKKLTSEIVIQV